jgi:hypothetical protein
MYPFQSSFCLRQAFLLFFWRERAAALLTRATSRESGRAWAQRRERLTARVPQRDGERVEHQ